MDMLGVGVSRRLNNEPIEARSIETIAWRERRAAFTPLQRGKSKRAGIFRRLVFLAVEAG
jgi:hypothetical protein